MRPTELPAGRFRTEREFQQDQATNNNEGSNHTLTLPLE